jgi:Fur family ferric uptake transcriptional regulator
MAINQAVFDEVTKIFTSYLERKVLRKTPERFAILEEIYTRTGHFFLVTKHQFGQNLSQFEKSYPSRQHDHLICTDCNIVVEFCDPRLYTIQKMVEDTQNFKVLHHSLTFYAHCQRENCENRKSNLVKVV